MLRACSLVLLSTSVLATHRDRPRLISEGEKQAALFNIACCYSRLEQVRCITAAICWREEYAWAAQCAARFENVQAQAGKIAKQPCCSLLGDHVLATCCSTLTILTARDSGADNRERR